MIMDKTFYNFLFNQGIVAAPLTPTFCSLSHSSMRIYIIIIFMIDNNNAVNNNTWKTPSPSFALQNFHGHAD